MLGKIYPFTSYYERIRYWSFIWLSICRLRTLECITVWDRMIEFFLLIYVCMCLSTYQSLDFSIIFYNFTLSHAVFFLFLFQDSFFHFSSCTRSSFSTIFSTSGRRDFSVARRHGTWWRRCSAEKVSVNMHIHVNAY